MFSLRVSDLNFLALLIRYAIETWMGNTLFDQISASRIVFIYRIFIAVKKFSESFQIFM